MAASNSQGGFGLLALLIGMAIGGILMSNLVLSIQSDLSINKNLKLQGQSKDIANYLAVGRDCALTTSSTNCPAEGYPIAIKKIDGTALVIRPESNNYTQLGSQLVKATCHLKLDPQNNSIIGRFFRVATAEIGQSPQLWKSLNLTHDQMCLK